MLPKLNKFLFAPSLPLWKYVLLAFLLAIIGSIIFFLTAFTVFSAFGINVKAHMPPHRVGSMSEIFGAVVFAPLVETFLLAGALKGLSSFIERTWVVAACSAVAWGLLHAFFGALWFFGPAWSFFVFSCGYLSWRKVSFGRAYAAAALPHALVNMVVMAIVFIAERG